MLCPICRKRECSRNVQRQFSGVVVYGEVCDKCYEVALSMPTQDFYRAFFMNEDRACSKCGRKLSEIESTLMVGCKECYLQFYTELKPLIDRLQGRNDDKD